MRSADFLRKAEGVAKLMREGATDGERHAAERALTRIASKAPTIRRELPEADRQPFDERSKQISPILFTGKLPHGYRVGVWVRNKSIQRTAQITGRWGQRKTASGQEEIFLIDGIDPANQTIWYEFSLRRATDPEIAREQRAREQCVTERHAKAQARLDREREMKRIRGDCELFLLAKTRDRKAMRLCGTGRVHENVVLFHAVGGKITSIKDYGNRGAATRAFNTATSSSYYTIDSSIPLFDALCRSLFDADKATQDADRAAQIAQLWPVMSLEEEQLADALAEVAAAVRAGRDLEQTLHYTAAEFGFKPRWFARKFSEKHYLLTRKYTED
jgi:hypothetical protein